MTKRQWGSFASLLIKSSEGIHEWEVAMSKTALTVALLFLSTCIAQPAKSDLPLPVPFRLTSDGHACSGYLHMKAKRLVWKSSFSMCASTSWSVQRQGDSWVSTLPPGPESKPCRIQAVRMRPMTGGL